MDQNVVVYVHDHLSTDAPVTVNRGIFAGVDLVTVSVGGVNIFMTPARAAELANKILEAK